CVSFNRIMARASRAAVIRRLLIRTSWSTRSRTLDHREVGRYWDGNAELWTRLARDGYDGFHDLMNNPIFFQMLPDVAGSTGLDVGCGEGHNTRLLALRGVRMTAIDISPKFVQFAREAEAQEPLGIEFNGSSAISLPFPDDNFDFATAFMSLMEFAEADQALREIHRVLRPGGFLQFSITHPCFDTPYRRRIRDD
ncbi:MAG: class I SAM-dependent methyltransferase, partial [Planctomycetota bacterium]